MKKQEIVGCKTEFRNQNKLIRVIFVKTSKSVAGGTQDGLMIIQYVCMYVGKGKLPACLRKGARDPNHFGSSLIMARTKQNKSLSLSLQDSVC